MTALVISPTLDFDLVKHIAEVRITEDREISEYWITESDYDRLYAAWNYCLDERKAEFHKLIDTIRAEIKERINRCPATGEDVEARIEAIEPELERKIEERLKGERIGIGFCHYYWGVKKQILHEDYGIDWKSPTELNPFTKYD